MQFVAWGFLVLQALIVVASLLGYGIFTSRPDLLVAGSIPRRASLLGRFTVLPSAICFSADSRWWPTLAQKSPRGVIRFVVVYAVSLASELMGTGWGVPFGPYSYTKPARSQVVRTRAVIDSPQLVHHELGLLDNGLPAPVGCRSDHGRYGLVGFLGSAARPGDEQGNQLLGLG